MLTWSFRLFYSASLYFSETRLLFFFFPPNESELLPEAGGAFGNLSPEKVNNTPLLPSRHLPPPPPFFFTHLILYHNLCKAWILIPNRKRMILTALWFRYCWNVHVKIFAYFIFMGILIWCSSQGVIKTNYLKLKEIIIIYFFSRLCLSLLWVSAHIPPRDVDFQFSYAATFIFRSSGWLEMELYGLTHIWKPGVFHLRKDFRFFFSFFLYFIAISTDLIKDILSPYSYWPTNFCWHNK